MELATQAQELALVHVEKGIALAPAVSRFCAGIRDGSARMDDVAGAELYGAQEAVA